MTTYIWEQSSYLTGADGKPVIIIIGRDTTTNKTKSFGVKGFTPYFYAEDPNGDVVSCHNTKLRKIECRHPQEVVAKRQYFESTYDADIPYDMRYLIDNDIYYAFDENLKPVDAPVHLPRVLYYDIEIYIKDGSMPDPARPDWEIVSISCRDSYTGKMRAFTLTEKKVNRYQVCCKSEEELLHKFMDFVLKYDFDVLAGWYSSGFDWLYIVNRAKKLRVDMSRLSRIPSQRVGPTRVPGRILADMLDLFKDWSKPLGQQPAYDLKSISRDPRFGDFDYDDFGASIPDLIEGDDWATLVQYSLNDVISLAKIDKKCGIFQFYEGIRRLTGIKLDNCLMKTRIIETFLMRNCKYPLPTRTMHEKEDFEGAYVVKPEMGIHEWVGGFDLAALYPSIIVAYNISPDAFNMIPSTIVKMMAERERLRAKRLSGEGGVTLATTEQSLKYIINSFYGVMGYKSFKLFDMECAKRIPKLGQDINRGIHAFLESEGYDIIYGDSVAGDSRIYIDGIGERKIEELFDHIDVVTPDGKEYYYPQNLMTDTITDDGEYTTQHIKCVIRHKTDKQMYRLWFTNSWYVDVTEDHSLIGWLNSQRGNGKPISKRLVPTKPLEFGHDFVNSVVSRRYLARPVQNSKNYPIEVYEFLGLFLGDGSAIYANHKYDYTFYMSTGVDFQELNERLFKPLVKLGYLTTYTLRDNGDVVFNKCKMSNIIRTYATDDNWKCIPSFIYTETQDAIAAYIRGAFTADGGVLTNSSGNQTIRFTQTKHWVCYELQRLMYMLGISTSIYRGNTVNTYNDYSNGSHSYYLYVSDAKTYADKIGFGLERKCIKSPRNGKSSTIDGLGFSIHRIHHIECLPKDEQYVYDLEIEDTHRFFANDILVHNTDSSYIYPIKDAESGLKVQSALNEYLRNWAEGMGVKRELAPRIKLEEIYRTIFFKKSKTGGGAAKKRYAGHVVWTDSDGYDVPPDKLDIKGFEIKRSDQAALTKELMSKVFHLLLIEDKPDDAIALIKDTYLEVYRGERTIAECAIPSAVKSDANSPHLRGMRAAEWLLGITWQGYEKPQLLYCRRPVPEICIPNGWTGDAFDEYIIVDWGLQADKIVKMKMEMIMESLGYSWAKSVEGQMSLADFM